MNHETTQLPNSLEKGQIGIYYLKRFWAKSLAMRNGLRIEGLSIEKKYDKALLDSLGLGLNPTINFIYEHSPSFGQFEEWVKINGQLETRGELANRFNALFDPSDHSVLDSNKRLSTEQHAFFEEHGYLVIENAISEDNCSQTISAISSFLRVDLNKKENWYQDDPNKHGIMVEFFDDPLLERNRFAPKIWNAYEALLGTTKLWVSTDRVSINPPETLQWKFPGPSLHLDIEPSPPLPFGLQGILYLTDVAEDQGALTVVPGFHKKINHWLQSFGNGSIPLTDVFDEYESKPIEANAGDFIIWHHGLPHGSSPNHNKSPRIAQYINLYTL